MAEVATESNVGCATRAVAPLDGGGPRSSMPGSLSGSDDGLWKAMRSDSWHSRVATVSQQSDE